MTFIFAIKSETKSANRYFAIKSVIKSPYCYFSKNLKLRTQKGWKSKQGLLDVFLRILSMGLNSVVKNPYWPLLIVFLTFFVQKFYKSYYALKNPYWPLLYCIFDIFCSEILQNVLCLTINSTITRFLFKSLPIWKQIAPTFQQVFQLKVY